MNWKFGQMVRKMDCNLSLCFRKKAKAPMITEFPSNVA